MTEEQIVFIKSLDFLRLGQAINHKNWQAAGMTVKRMEKNAKECGMDEFGKWFMGIKQCVAGGNREEALSIMTLVTNKRVQYMNKLAKDVEGKHE